MTGVLHDAIRRGDVDTAKDIYEKNRTKLFLSCCSNFIGPKPKTQCFYPIHAAASARRGGVPMLRWLVEEHNCDVHVLCSDGSSPMETAAACGQIESVMYLFGKGASLESIRPERLVRYALSEALERMFANTRAASERAIAASAGTNVSMKESIRRMLRRRVTESNENGLLLQKGNAEKKRKIPPVIPPSIRSMRERKAKKETPALPPPLPRVETAPEEKDDENEESDGVASPTIIDPQEEENLIALFADMLPDEPSARSPGISNG